MNKDETNQIIALSGRVGRLEGGIEGMSKTLDTIQNNHLVHLASDVKEVKRQVDNINLLLAKWIGAAVVVLALIQYVLNR